MSLGFELVRCLNRGGRRFKGKEGGGVSSYLGVGLGEWEGGTVEYLAVPKS